MDIKMSSVFLPSEADRFALGGIAEIRDLVKCTAGELTHVLAAPMKTSFPMYTQSTSQWFFATAGNAELWCGVSDSITELSPGYCARIPPGTPFQYRTSGAFFEFIFASMPPWLPENRFLIDQGNWVSDAPYPFHRAAFPESTEASPIELFQLPSVATHIAPDGSEIRELGDEPAGGLAVCTLPPGHVTRAVRHQTIEELWYVLDGRGELSRRKGVSPTAVVTPLRPGAAVNIEPESVFQFRGTGREDLNILILTMPRWPGPEEAIASDSEETWKPTDVGNGAFG